MGLLTERSEDDEERGDISIAGLDGLDGGAPEETLFELDEWSEGDRAVLRDRLETLGVPHQWEGFTLVVAATDEAWVERVMDQVDEALSNAATDTDPEEAQIAYDLAAWNAHHRDRLVVALREDAVPFEMDGDEIFVPEIDEQRVDEMIDAVLRPGATPSVVAAAGPEVMGELFVAADRLVHDPTDHDGTLSLIGALRAAGEAPPPYGMDKVWWDRVLGHAETLVALLDIGDDDDLKIDAATELRDALRPYV